MTDESKFNIKKFDGKINFNLWKVDMFDHLVQRGLEQAIEEGGKPSDMKDKDWEKIDRKALSLIRICLADEVKCNILDMKSAAELWAKLDLDYTGSSMLDRLYLKRKLFRFTMKEGTTLHDHLVQFQQVVAELRAIDSDSLTDEDKAFNLIYSLPDSYENLITTMLHGRSAKEKLTVDGVIKSLKENELRKQTKGAAESSFGSALAADESADEGNRAKRGKPRCQFCQKRGHIKKDCWKLHGRKDEVHSASAYDSVQVNNQDMCLLASSSEVEFGWYLDTGSSSHVCPNKGMFTDYRTTTGRSIRAGTGEECTVVGEGTVQLEMTDGREFTLRNVLHVPRQKVGLISLGTLEAQGCRYSARGGVLTVWKGHRRMICGKRGLNSFLYQLKGGAKTRPSCLQPSVPQAVQPTHSSPVQDYDDRTSSRGEDLEVGGVRAEIGNPAITLTPGLLVGSIRCPPVPL